MAMKKRLFTKVLPFVFCVGCAMEKADGGSFEFSDSRYPSKSLFPKEAGVSDKAQGGR
jgi:hypothetical protein